MMYGYSQREVATKIGLNNGNPLSEWELGKKYPSMQNLFKLCIVYRTLPSSLYEAEFLRLRETLSENAHLISEEDESVSLC